MLSKLSSKYLLPNATKEKNHATIRTKRETIEEKTGNKFHVCSPKQRKDIPLDHMKYAEMTMMCGQITLASHEIY